ncbi:hypothetical protein TNCV_3072981 [Trichonephila clavipes]|nr:hypothetical protein TNCV_3072981 [Trichonephila clavipes]
MLPDSTLPSRQWSHEVPHSERTERSPYVHLHISSIDHLQISIYHHQAYSIHHIIRCMDLTSKYIHTDPLLVLDFLRVNNLIDLV